MGLRIRILLVQFEKTALDDSDSKSAVKLFNLTLQASTSLQLKLFKKAFSYVL